MVAMKRPNGRARVLALLGLLAGHLSFAARADSHACYLSSHQPSIPTAPQRQLVLIIDDIGFNLHRGSQALGLPGKITFSVIPYTPHGKALALHAHNSGKEVMLHAPMSTVEGLPLGRGGLTAEQSRAEFRDTLAAALQQVPYVRGVNNHMGSDLTQRRPQMAWLMQALRQQDLYFVDSRTIHRSVAATVAAEFSVPHLSRHVFLDNERTMEAIDERFQALLATVERNGVAVAIGHPYPETIAYLRQALPLLAERGINLAFASEVLPPPLNRQLAEDAPLLPDTTAAVATRLSSQSPRQTTIDPDLDC